MVIFIDLRDRTGITQVVFNAERNLAVHQAAHSLRSECVVSVSGQVMARPDESQNPDLSTGEVEIFVDEVEILNEAKTPPFVIEDDAEVTEAIRLKYRFLDLRRPRMQQLLSLRHGITQATREFVNAEGFLEVETPILTKSTPEGARDYLVPSRVNAGQFFALPQSPQLFKQVLMVSGVDRYYQIARCFRDEDLRNDRQPEFTQIDLELSFVDREQVMTLMERMITTIFMKVGGVQLPTPFPRMTYAEAMGRYGSDKPDLRFEMPLYDVTAFGVASEFKVFKDAATKGGMVKALIVKGGATLSRTRIDALGETAKSFGAKGLAWLKLTAEGQLESVIAKFLDAKAFAEALPEAKPGDLVLFGVEDDLCDACSVTKINKDDHAMVSPSLDPAVQHNGLPYMLLLQLAAAMCADVHAVLAFFPTYFLVLSGLAQPSRLTSRLGPAFGSSPFSTEVTRSSTSSRKALASRSVRKRNSPGSRWPSASGPILTRISLITICPTDSNMRFTWCLRPSRIVISSQEFASALLIFLTTAGLVMPSSSLTPRWSWLISASVSTPLTLIR
jgi:hypothetical protein